MRTNYHQMLFDTYFRDLYRFCGLSHRDYLNLPDGILTDPSAVLVAIYGQNYGLNDPDGNPIQSELGERIRPYVPMIRAKHLFDRFKDADRIKGKLRFNSTEDSITPSVRELPLFKDLDELLSYISIFDDNTNINYKKCNMVEKELEGVRDRIIDRTLNEADWEKYSRTIPNTTNLSDDERRRLCYDYLKSREVFSYSNS